MPVKFSPKEAIAEVAGVAVAAWAASGLVDAETAKLFGGLAKGLVKGVKYSKKGETPKEQLLKVIREATESALESAGCEFVPECREAIVQNIFSFENASGYVLAGDKESLLYNTLRTIIGGFADCDPETFPVEKVANHIVAFAKEGIEANTDLLLLNTSIKVDAIYAMLVQARESISNQQDASAPWAKWLTVPCGSASPHYVDRPEFQKLMAAVTQHRKVLLFGMGGIGKTELMRKACEALKGEYQQAAWVQYTGNLASSLTSQIAVDEFKTLPEKEKLEAIKKTLMQAGEDLLLFVDNISSTAQEDKDIEWLQRLEGTVIVTARPPNLLTGFVDVPVGSLEAEECKKLFYAYAGMQPLTDETGLEEIINLAGRHTLVLEILARCAKVRNMPVSELLQRMRDKGFDIKIPVATAHSKEAPEILPEQLEKLYEISDIQDNPLYVHILKNFSILPYLPLSDEDAIAFLELDDEQENALYDLRDLGWLEQSDSGFAMHPVIRQVMRKEKVALVDCKRFIRKLLNAANDFFSKVKYRPYIAKVAEYFHDVDALIGRLYNNLSLIHQAMGNLPDALRWQMKAIEITEALYPDYNHPDLATDYDNLSLIYQHMGNLPEALKWQMKALKIREVLFPDGKQPDLATSYNNLSSICWAIGNLPEALRWQMKATENMEALFPEGKHPYLATSYNNLAMIHRDMGNLLEALKWQMKAKEIREGLFQNGKHPDLAQSNNNLSSIHRIMGNLLEALKWQKKAIEIMEALFPGGKHPNLATSYNNLSLIHQDMGNLPEALLWQMKAAEIMEALFPDGKHPNLASSYSNLSLIHKDIGNLPESLQWQMKSKEIREDLYPDGKHPDLAGSYNNLSLIHCDMGNLPEALKWQMRAIEILEALFPDGKHHNLATSYNNLSLIYHVMGNLPEALKRQMKAIEIRKNLFPDGIHPSLAISYGNLSSLYEDMGKPEEAARWRKEADRIEEEIRKRDAQ